MTKKIERMKMIRVTMENRVIMVRLGAYAA
jgi:hypothetical protein